MKLILFILLGVASVLCTKELDNAGDAAVHLFGQGPSLRSVMGLKHMVELHKLENDIKIELGKTLRDALNKVINDIKDAVNQGKEVASKLIDKAKEIVQKLKDIGVDAGEKTRDIVQEIRDKAKDWLRDALDKLGLTKRSVNRNTREILDRVDMKIIFLKLIEMISDKVDVEKLVQFIRDNFSGFSELSDELVETIRRLGLQGFRDLLTRLLDLEGGKKMKRAIINPLELIEKLKNFFKDFQLDLKLVFDFRHFFQWVVDTIKKGFDATLPLVEKIKKLGEDFLDQMEFLGKDVAREAVGFFGLFKKDIPDLFKDIERKFDRLF